MATVVLVPQTVNVTLPVKAFSANKVTGAVSQISIPTDILSALSIVENWMVANNVTLISTGNTGT